MRSVEEALAEILRYTPEPVGETVPLREAWGRVLAGAVRADTPLPPFHNSAVDGYAVQAKDTASATRETPVRLRTLGDIPAGAVGTETVLPGTAARIMTGAVVPEGADAVVMVEETETRAGEVAIREAVRPGQHIRRAGEEMAFGAIGLTAGTSIRASEIGLLATLGMANVPVFRRPSVAVLSTGDELIDVGEGVPPPGKIRDSNRYTLEALVREAGGEVCFRQHIPDDPAATEAALNACIAGGAEIIVTAGGVSVGDRDYVKPTLEKMGTLALWKVAMKPGKPLAFGRIGETLFFGLPGNPVSVLVTFELFVRPVLRKWLGFHEDSLLRPTVIATLTETVGHTPGRREYVRARTQWHSGGFLTTPTGSQSSSRLHSMTLANSLLVVPENSDGLASGTKVTVLLLD